MQIKYAVHKVTALSTFNSTLHLLCMLPLPCSAWTSFHIHLHKSTLILPLLQPELLSQFTYKYPSASPFCIPKYLCPSPHIHFLHLLHSAFAYFPKHLYHFATLHSPVFYSYSLHWYPTSPPLTFLTSTYLSFLQFAPFFTSSSLSHIHPFYSLVFDQQPSLIPLSTSSSTPYIVHLLLLPSQPESGVWDHPQQNSGDTQIYRAAIQTDGICGGCETHHHPPPGWRRGCHGLQTEGEMEMSWCWSLFLSLDIFLSWCYYIYHSTVVVSCFLFLCIYSVLFFLVAYVAFYCLILFVDNVMWLYFTWLTLRLRSSGVKYNFFNNCFHILTF